MVSAWPGPPSAKPAEPSASGLLLSGANASPRQRVSDHGGMRRASGLPLSPARSRRQIHPVVPSDNCVRSGRATRAACAQPELECLCGALGQVGEGGVPIQGGSVRRALPAAGRGRICRALPHRAKSSREGQCPAIRSGRADSFQRWPAAEPSAIKAAVRSTTAWCSQGFSPNMTPPGKATAPYSERFGSPQRRAGLGYGDPA